MENVILIEKSKRHGATRAYIPIGKEMTDHNRILWFTRHGDAWFLYDNQVVWFKRHQNVRGMFLRGNRKKGTESVMREDISLMAGKDGSMLLEALFSSRDLKFVNLCPRTPNVSRAVLVVERKTWREWRTIQTRIMVALVRAGYSKAGVAIDLPSAV